MRLVFVGNSHTYVNEMPHIVELLFKAYTDIDPDITMITQPGQSLMWHSNQISTQFNLKYGKYDYVILQDVAHPFEGKEHLMEDVDAIMQYIPETKKKCFYMTWGSYLHPEWHEQMDEAYTAAAEKYSAEIAPVGRIWKRIRYECSDINLFYTDGEHASIYGSYLAACTIFCTVTDRKIPLPEPDDSIINALGMEKRLCDIIHKYVSDEIGKKSN